MSVRDPESPLTQLKRGNPKKNRRRLRRAFTDDELRWLIRAATNRPEHCGVPGPVRGLLYRLVAETGLRQNEARTLTPEAFDLDGDPPTVTVHAAYAKAGREDVVPLRSATAADLRELVRDTPRGEQVFPILMDHKQFMRIFRGDLEAAGVAYRDEDGWCADFHALRYTFVTNLARGGITPKMAMDLARHRDINLTLARYSHTGVQDRARALEALPDLRPQPSVGSHPLSPPIHQGR